MSKDGIYEVKYHNPFIAWMVLSWITCFILPIYWAISPKHTYSKKKLKNSAKSITCPYCGSKNIQVVGDDGKKISVSKAVAGSMLLPGGAALGLNGKSKGLRFFCQDCNKLFSKKL